MMRIFAINFNGKQYYTILFIFIFVLPLALALDGLLRAEPALAHSTPMILAGGLVILFLPGLLLADIMRARLRTIPELIAKSFILSLLANILLSLPFFLAKASLTGYCIALWIVCAVGSIRLAFAIALGRTPYILLFLMRKIRLGLAQRTQWEWTALGLILIPAAVLAYWGEDLSDTANEKILHLMFVRQYFGMPLDIWQIGIEPGMPVPNLINLYEFLLAAWARLGGIDPLFVFGKARALNPIIGFSALFVFIRCIFLRKREANLVFFTAFLLCLGGLFVIKPSNVDWVLGDPTRFVFHLMGSAHHSDSAMAILLPLGLMAGLLLLRRPTLEHILLWVTMLVASFLWHPREFAQLAYYMGFSGCLIPLSGRKNWISSLKRWGLAMGLSVLTAILLVTFSSDTRKYNPFDEQKLSLQAFNDALRVESMVGITNPMRIPLHFRITQGIEGAEKQNFWLYLYGGAVFIVAVFGGMGARQLAFYSSVLHIISLSWQSGMLMILGLTYHEFFMSTPRLIYLFCLVTIASGIVTIATKVVAQGGIARTLLLAAGMMAAGFGIGLWRDGGMPLLSMAVIILGSGVLITPIIVCLRHCSGWTRNLKIRHPGIVVISSVAFCATLLWPMYAHVGKHLSFRHENRWFSENNPSGLSIDLLKELRRLPSGRTLFADPGKIASFFIIYAPLYAAICPAGTVYAHWVMNQEMRNKQNPVLHAAIATDDGRSGLFDWLEKRKVDYILLKGKEEVQSPQARFMRGETVHFTIVFENNSKQELLLKYNRGLIKREHP